MSNKFEKGDTVVRFGKSYIGVKKGEIYTVSEVIEDNVIRLHGISGVYLAVFFNLIHDGETHSSINTQDN